MSEDPIHRGRRWDAFFNEPGGLAEMFDVIGKTYIERMSSVEPWETDKLSKLAMAHKITNQVRGMVHAIVTGADVAQAARDYTDKIERLPSARRRWI